MLDEEGRRCWTLLYRQDSDNVKEHYHMDILPCVADTGYTERLQRMVALSFSAAEVDKIAIRITDNKASGYYTSTDKGNWMKSNPDGYAMWFASRCKNAMEMRATIMNGVEIGSGSTVGANSFVCKKKFPANCCLAGNPAKVLREQTAWIRDGVIMHEDVEDYLDFIYDD